MMDRLARAAALLMALGAVAACAPEAPRDVVLVQPTLYNKDGSAIGGGECPDGYIPGTNVNECIPFDCPEGGIYSTQYEECRPPSDCPPGQTLSSQTLECIPIGDGDPDPQRPEPDPQDPAGGQPIN